MKTARLIKRNLLGKPFDMEEKRQIGSQTTAKDARKSAMKWVRERQELRGVCLANGQKTTLTRVLTTSIGKAPL
jgi:hypothetical protein